MLARLGLSEGEVDLYAAELGAILVAIDRLGEVDVDSIAPTAQVVEVSTVLGDDLPRPSLTQEQVLENAPESRDGFIAVRAILDQGD